MSQQTKDIVSRSVSASLARANELESAFKTQFSDVNFNKALRELPVEESNNNAGEVTSLISVISSKEAQIKGLAERARRSFQTKIDFDRQRLGAIL